MGMDPFLTAGCVAASPEPNVDILRGISVPQMEFFTACIDEIWRTVAKEFPAQLRYIGPKVYNPLEEYRVENNLRKVKVREVDVARNSIHLVNYRMEFTHPDGRKEEVPFHQYMPHVTTAGLLWLSGAQWGVAPMLGDVVLSFEKERLFCQFARAKFHIENVNHTIVTDGVETELNVPWSIVYNIRSPKPIIKISLLHYVIASRGLRQAFKDLMPGIPIDFVDGAPDESIYPRDKWTYIESGKPKSKPFFGGTDITVVVGKDVWETAPQWTRTLVASLFFILDRFGAPGSAVWGMEMKADPKYSEDIQLWRLCMSAILWERTKNPVVAIDDINKHMKSLDRYIDDLVQPRVKHIGMDVDNLYDFFGKIIENWEDWRLNSYKLSAAVYTKEINSLYQVYSGIMKAIFFFHFHLENEAAKGPITIDKLKDLQKKFIRPRMIFNIRKDAHQYVAPIAYSGDNAFCKITSIVVPQRGSSSGGDGHGAAATRLHASLPEVTSPINLTKKDSAGLTRFNFYVKLKNYMYVERDPEMVKLTEAVQSILDKEMRNVGSVLEEDMDLRELSRLDGDD